MDLIDEHTAEPALLILHPDYTETSGSDQDVCIIFDLNVPRKGDFMLYSTNISFLKHPFETQKHRSKLQNPPILEPSSSNTTTCLGPTRGRRATVVSTEPSGSLYLVSLTVDMAVAIRPATSATLLA